MKRLFIALSMAAMAIVQPAFAEERGTPEEARAMSLKAAAYVREHGRETAAQAFMTPGGEWHDRDLYVFALDNHGVSWANGANQALVGRSYIDVTDVSGKFFNRDMIAIETEGWVDYLWESPVTGEVEMKSSYIVRVPEDGIVGVGAYQE